MAFTWRVLPIILVLLVLRCSDGSAPAPVSVSVGPPSASLLAGGRQTFTATVANDPSGQGVTWSITGCSSVLVACGSLVSVSRTNATYQAGLVPPPGTVGVTATSVTDGTKSFTVAVAVTTVNAIVGGTLDDNRYPEVGALVLTSDHIPFCSGVLISPTLFLTAGHCEHFWTSALSHGDYGVTFDQVVTPSSPVILATGHIHPDWGIVEPVTDNFTINNDVSVYVLDHPVANIRPAELPDKDILDKLNSKGRLATMTFVTVGYGITDVNTFEGQGTRRVALQGFVELMPDHDHLQLTETPGGSCYFDSGGPHYFAGTHTIASTTSGGDALCATIDETTRIDTKSVLKFVRSFMKAPARQRDDEH